MTLTFDGWLWKTIGRLFYTTSIFLHNYKAMGEVKLELHPGKAQFGSNRRLFVPRDLQIWWMTLKNNTVPLGYYIKLYHHFKAIEVFKLELQSGDARFKSKWAICVPVSHVTLKFDDWLSKPIGQFFYGAPKLVHHYVAVDGWFFVHCVLEIWQMVLKYNRASLTSHIKFYASFHCHVWNPSYGPETAEIVLTSVILTFDL